jgi:hypothetical protein
MSIIIDVGPSDGQACQEWQRGPLKGRLPHIPLPFSRLGDQVEIGCDRCGAYLYTYQEEPRLDKKRVAA